MIKNRNLVFGTANNSSAADDKFFQLPEIANASLPAAAASNEGGIVYDATNNKVYFSDGSSWAALDTATGSTAYDDITNPDANKTIAFAGYTNTWTSSLNSAGGVFTISNTTADLTANVSVMDLKLTDDGDANGFFLRAYDNAGGDLKFQVGPDGAVTVAGNATGTAALTISAGDITMTSGDIDIAADNRRVSFGASGDTDSYIYFDGAGNLTFYDSTAGAATLSQLVSASPTGNFTISGGKFTWTDSINEAPGVWTFANTTGTDIAISSAITSGKGLSITATGATTGSLLYLSAVTATLTSGLYIQCYDGAANDFTVADHGATIIAGTAAGTDAFTITAGTVQVTDGNADFDEGKVEVDTTTDETSYVKRNLTGATSAVVEIEATHTGDTGSALLLDHKGTGNAKALEITHAGDLAAIDISASAARTGNVINIPMANQLAQTALDITGAATGTSGEGIVHVDVTGVLAGNAIRVDSTGANAATGQLLYLLSTGNQAGATNGIAAYFEDQGAAAATSYTVYISSTSNEALKVDAGVVQFDEALTLGVDDTGADLKAFGATTGKYVEWDESADSLFLTNSTVFRVGGTETPDGVTMDFDGADFDVDAVTANDNIKFGSDVDTNVIFTTAASNLTIDHGANSLTLAAGGFLKIAGSGTGKGLVIPVHATASPNEQDGAFAGNIFFEVDAKKLWVYDGTSWVGVVLA